MCSMCVECVCGVYIGRLCVYVECICVVCVYKVYVWSMCVTCVWSVYYVCGVCVWSICMWIMCICGVYMCSVCVLCVCVRMCTMCMECVCLHVHTCLHVEMAPGFPHLSSWWNLLLLSHSGFGSPDTWGEDVSSGKVRAEMGVGDKGHRRLALGSDQQYPGHGRRE